MPVDLSIMIEGQMGLTWQRWRGLAPLVEELGFAGLFRSDHFVGPRPPDDDALEAITSMTWLADHTSRIRFGPLVAPVSFRDPVMLARQAAALQELSGGRFVLGMGAGWMEREHEMFGYRLLDVDQRFARLREGLEVATRLLRDDAPVTFNGAHWSVRDAALRPRPAMPPAILVGGSGIRRTLPLAARYADEWNGVFLSPDAFRDRSERLDKLLEGEGRDPSSVRRSVMTGLYLDRDDESLRARGALAGSLGQVRSQLDALAEAGVGEVMMQWFALDDLDGLRKVGRELLG